MKVITGKVVAGRILVKGEPLEESCTVTVLAPELDEAFVLDAKALHPSIPKAPGKRRNESADFAD
jgi:hypothetical protein